MQTLHNEWILILDFGSQYTQLIARRLRELNVYCEIHPYNTPPASIGDNFPKGIILSGGPRRVYDYYAYDLYLDYLKMVYPELGICCVLRDHVPSYDTC